MPSSPIAAAAGTGLASAAAGVGLAPARAAIPSDDDPFRCAICFSEMAEPCTAACGAHNFCLPCLAAWIARQQPRPRCPLCKRLIQSDASELRVNVGIREACALRASKGVPREGSVRSGVAAPSLASDALISGVPLLPRLSDSGSGSGGGGGGGALTAASLPVVAAPRSRVELGTALLPLVASLAPAPRVAKCVGMLLALPAAEVEHLLATPPALASRVHGAVALLDANAESPRCG